MLKLTMGSLSTVLFFKFVLEIKCEVIMSLQDIISRTQRSTNVISSSSGKRVSTRTTIPPQWKSYEGKLNDTGIRQSHPREKMV